MVGKDIFGLPRNVLVWGLPLWSLLLAWCDIVTGQVLGSIEDRRERAVPVLSPEKGTAPTRPQADSTDVNIAVLFDSLELKLLDIEIQKAKERTSETTFWKRIIPQVHVSGSFGVRDVVFIDPTTFTSYILPRDAYRLTVSFTLNEIFNFSKHSLAELEVNRLSTEQTLWFKRKAHLHRSIKQQLTVLQEQMEVFQEELSIVQELLRFNQLRFEQGKIEFDSLMRTKLELLSVQKAVQRIQHQKLELQLKLSQGNVQ